MLEKLLSQSFVGAVVLATLAAPAMGVTIETVFVGNPGNAGELSGYGPGGYGHPRICGAVDYVFNIGKFEVTAGQYTEFLNAVASSDPYGLYNGAMDSDSLGCQITRLGISGSYTYDFSGGTVEASGSTAADWENRPVNYVSWGDAARFCNWLENGQPTGTMTGDPAEDAGLTEDGSYLLNGAMSKTELVAVTRKPNAIWVIPSEDEWYKAAYHKNDGVTGNYFDYPTSRNSVPSNDLAEPTDPGNHATFYNNGDTIGSPYYRTEVGEHENSESPYDTFDQGGNIFEWNEAIITDAVHDLGGGTIRGLRGGSFYSGGNITRALSRGYLNPVHEDIIVGFRVASVPEPGSITLLVCGAVGLLVYGWRKRRRG